MPSPFIGTWLLVSQYTHHPDGTISPTRGENPAGVITYDQHGNMAVQLARTDDKASLYTDETDLRTALEGFLAYFGRYEVDEAQRIVKHHITGSSSPHYRGTTQVRHYEFSADTLALRAESPIDSTIRVLVWRRIEEQI